MSQLMHTPAVVCRPTATVQEVARQMAARNVGCVIVVDSIGYVAGIVTDRDLALRGPGAGRSPEAPVESIMTRDVVTISPAAGLDEAAALMGKRGVRRLPVVDELGTPHGMLTFDDLLRNLAQETVTLTDTLYAQATNLRMGP